MLRKSRPFPGDRERGEIILESETDARGRRFQLLPIPEAPRSAVPDGEEIFLPFLREFLSRERRRHCAVLRMRGGRRCD
jgi:hypothetical protein